MSTATATKKAPAPLIAEVGARVHLTGAAPPDFVQAVKEALTFDNPKYAEAVRMDRFTWNIPKHLVGYAETDTDLLIPRGFGPQLLGMAERHGLELEIQDRTRTLPEVGFTFKGILRDFQAEAARAVLKRPLGVLSIPTGGGKTVVGLYVIAKRKQPALVVVHTKELLHQWIDRIETFLGIPAEDVGVIGDGRKDLAERITVGIINSVYKCAHEIAPMIGHVVVDECHRAPSRTFTEAVNGFDARYRLGLSATPWRRDKLSRLIYWGMGDLAHEVGPEALRENGDILRAEVRWRRTSFETLLDPSEEYSKMLSELTQDPGRNELIASDVAREAKKAGSGIALVLSDRKAHVSALAALLEALNVPTACLTGDMGSKARTEALAAVTTGKARVLCATGQLIGEGFDLPAMSALFLATPIRFDGRVLQYVGRVLRPTPGKDRAVVFDYEDVKVGPLRASARARGRVYEQHGMKGAP
jgi:superfamily II DNA or RNA helicase